LGKSQSFEQLLAALRSIAKGEPVFGLRPHGTAARNDAGPTARQLQVLALALVAQGQPNKRIACALGIAERAVKLHITALLHTLGARNRTHLLIVGCDKGLV
jgi:DNA-binding NarL/FixJ family response regulator